MTRVNVSETFLAPHFHARCGLSGLRRMLSSLTICGAFSGFKLVHQLDTPCSDKFASLYYAPPAAVATLSTKAGVDTSVAPDTSSDEEVSPEIPFLDVLLISSIFEVRYLAMKALLRLLPWPLSSAGLIRPLSPSNARSAASLLPCWSAPAPAAPGATSCGAAAASGPPPSPTPGAYPAPSAPRPRFRGASPSS